MVDSYVRIGSLTITPPIFLAPMAGLTHSALRQLILDFGGVGLLSTEMLSAPRLQNEDPALSPYLISTPREHPISYQLLIYKEEHIEKAVKRVEELGADVIDINLGCCAPKVRKKGGGIGLASDLKRLSKIISKIKELSSVPLTAKIRIGQDASQDMFMDYCKFLEDSGIDCLYIHARLFKEPFCRPARWQFISCLNGKIGIPYVVNGGIFSREDAKKAIKESEANGVMIGRGGAIRPWLFKEISENITLSPYLPEVFFAFSGYLQRLFPEKRRLGRLKEFTHYFAKNYAFGNRLAMSVQRAASMAQALEEAAAFFQKNEEDFHLPSEIEELLSACGNMTKAR